jgi:hypothetical protein
MRQKNEHWTLADIGEDNDSDLGNDLTRCPHCTTNTLVDTVEAEETAGHFQVECSKCKMRGPIAANKRLALSFWKHFIPSWQPLKYYENNAKEYGLFLVKTPTSMPECQYVLDIWTWTQAREWISLTSVMLGFINESHFPILPGIYVDPQLTRLLPIKNISDELLGRLPFNLNELGDRRRQAVMSSNRQRDASAAEQYIYKTERLGIMFATDYYQLREIMKAAQETRYREQRGSLGHKFKGGTWQL